MKSILKNVKKFYAYFCFKFIYHLEKREKVWYNNYISYFVVWREYV